MTKTEVMRKLKRIGKVVVDHGKTSCKTPDAQAAIQMELAKRAQKTAS